MDKIRSQLEGDSERLLAFKRQWLRMHTRARLSARAVENQDLRSPIRNVIIRMTGPVPISPNTDQLRILRRIDHRRRASAAAYAKQRASPKTYGQAITPETARTTPILPERISNEDFETTSKQTIATTLVAAVTALWEDISMMIIEWTRTISEIDIAPHRSTMTTAPEANTIATALLRHP
jgi:hypothetical protein